MALPVRLAADAKWELETRCFIGHIRTSHIVTHLLDIQLHLADLLGHTQLTFHDRVMESVEHFFAELSQQVHRQLRSIW